MPEQEFDLYLSLLVRLLRLSPEQKTSIEAELRDHFEERFEALVRSGTPRDVAIRRTLDEFGDVAGLANQFTHLSRKHIRRRIMQGTLATAGVAAAVVIWATLFRGPEPAIGPAPNVVAQDGQQAAAAANPADDATAVAAAANDALAGSTLNGEEVEWIDPGRFMPEKLTKIVPVEFSGTPLRDVISYISEVADIRILFDSAALSEEGITGDEEVSFVQTVPVHTALTVLLSNVNEVQLAWMQDAEVIRITTKDKADNTHTTQYYNVRDLLNAGYTHEQLLDIVLEMTEGPWELIDGIGGTIAEFGDLLVVKQCQRTQIDVACTLAGLRGKTPARLIGELPSHARLYEVLDSQTNIEFSGTPLRDVMNYIAEIHSIPIVFDTTALSEEGITGDEEVSLVVNGIKLQNALKLLLENVNQVQLAVVIRDGALWVTTKDQADNTLRTVLYDVADITADDPLQMEKLEEVVKAQTEGPWEDIDGIGGVLLAATPRLLACRQTLNMQDEVRGVLAAIRASLKASGGDRNSLVVESTKLETRFYRLDAEAAEDIARLIPDLIEPGTWKLAGFVPPSQEEAKAAEAQIGTIHRLAAGRMLLRLDSGTVVDSGDKHAEVADPLTTTAPQPQNAPPGGDATGAGNSNIVVIPQAVLIITHKPSVLRQVSKLLQTLLSGQGWWSGNSGDDKVKFITPGFQEGTWKGSLGGPGGPQAPAGGGFFSIESHERR